MLDRVRLAKVLAMTTSNHDGEALSAVRKANDILKSENLTWSDLLGQAREVTITVTRHAAPTTVYEPTESWTPPHLKDKVTLDLMFRTLFDHVPPGYEFREFLDSVHAWYRKHGSVTAKQYQALRNAYVRVSK